MRKLMMLVSCVCVLTVAGFIGGETADAGNGVTSRLRCRIASFNCQPSCRPACRPARRCCAPVRCCRPAPCCCARTNCCGNGTAVSGENVEGEAAEGESQAVTSPSDVPVEAPDAVPEAPIEEGEAAAEGESA